MGTVHAHRGRLAPALILAVLAALAVVVALSLAAGPASARPAFEPVCVGCHTQATVHAVGSHSFDCTTCHVSGTATPPPTSACGGCHGGVTAILAKTTHAANACGTTPGCHGVPPAVATTAMTLKVSPTIVRLGRTVKATGTAGPVSSLAGAKVSLKVQRKVGTRWVKMKTAAKTVSATGTFSWKYKPLKKGPYRLTASIAKSSTHTAKKVVKTFRVR